jgi:hypothetical protein
VAPGEQPSLGDEVLDVGIEERGQGHRRGGYEGQKRLATSAHSAR